MLVDQPVIILKNVVFIGPIQFKFMARTWTADGWPLIIQPYLSSCLDVSLKSLLDTINIPWLTIWKSQHKRRLIRSAYCQRYLIGGLCQILYTRWRKIHFTILNIYYGN